VLDLLAGNKVRQRGRNDTENSRFRVRKLEYRTLTFTSRLRESILRLVESTRTSPFMRGPQKARRGKVKRHSENVSLIWPNEATEIAL